MNNRLRYELPRLLIPSSHALPPVECCFGTSPSRAAKSRPLLKASSVADGGHQSRCDQGTDARNIPQSLTRCILAGYAVDLSAQRFDLFFQYFPLLPQPIDQPPHSRRQSLFGVFKQIWYLFSKVCPPLPESDAPLKQKGAQLIYDTGAARNKPVPHAMESLKIKLIVRLDRDKAHVRPLQRFSNSLGIQIVVLVRLQEGLYKLCRHKPDCVSLGRQRRTKEMSSAARFHAD
jgi:hypothetical protein